MWALVCYTARPSAEDTPMKTALSLLMLGALLFAQAPGSRLLKEVHRIYVGPLGESDDANLVREKLVAYLTDAKSVKVTEDEKGADAVLSGRASVKTQAQGIYVNRTLGVATGGGTVEDIQLVVKVMSPDKTVLWAYDADGGKCLGPAAKCAVKELDKAILKARAAK